MIDSIAKGSYLALLRFVIRFKRNVALSRQSQVSSVIRNR